MTPPTTKQQDTFGLPSNLAVVVGFDVAEEAYDRLTFREQIVIDLLIEGFSHKQIAHVFGVTQPTITGTVRRIRTKLASSKLKMVLDARQEFRFGIQNNPQSEVGELKRRAQ